MLGPVRLLLRRATTALLLLVLLSDAAQHIQADEISAVSTIPPDTSSCKRLTDKDSPFASALSLLAGIGGGSGVPAIDPSVFGPLDQSLPTVSQCIAAINPLALLTSLTSSSSPLSLQCSKDLNAFSTTQFVTADGTILFGEKVCPAFAKLAPCLTDLLLPQLEKVMANTNGCCSPMLAQVNAGFGAPMTEALTSLVHIVGNTFCSQRVSIEAAVAPENCGDSLLHNWLPLVDGEDEREYWNLINTFQIPNDQACKAARSEPFVTTMNETQQYGAPGVASYGICYTSMDAMQQYVRALPFWKVAGGDEMAKMVEAMYKPDSCVPGTEFLKWATDDSGSFMRGVRMLDDLAGTLSAAVGQSNSTSPSPTVSPVPTTSTGGPATPTGGPATSTPEPTTPTPEPTTPTPEPTPTEPSFIAPSPSSDASNDSDDGSNGGPAIFDRENNEGGPTLEELAGKNWTEIVRAKLWELNLVADQLCLHIPNGVACSFPGEFLQVPFAQIGTTSVDTDGSGQAPTSVPSPQPTVAATTPSPVAANSSTSNGTSAAANARQHYDSALTVVAISTLAALALLLL